MIVKTKILDGPVFLRKTNIDANSVKINGQPLSSEFILDAKGGTIKKLNPNQEKTVYTIEFNTVGLSISEAKALQTKLVTDASINATQRYVPAGKEMIYTARSEEVSRWVSSSKQTPTALEYPYANQKATRLAVPLETILAEWETIKDGLQALNITIQDLYEVGLESIVSAISINEVEDASSLAITALDAI